MSNFPKNFVVDTNVPKTANLAIAPGKIPQELTKCVYSCVEAVEHIIKKGGLVMDSQDEIFDEYRGKLLMKGQPGVGDQFMKWVHDNRWKLPDCDRVKISRNGDTYDEFPTHAGLTNFDSSDRKFVAVANAHIKKPPILQATDSKWWGWKEALTDVGITVFFLCPDYVEAKYTEKMGA
ncbi:MAG: hypothetical protein A2V87_08890 [Deltaproteobacteria bacterium RBG_16_58_17]|nr:MAG: hypothetical protein A2V87_08890 [Deltaproteobacteria bacterium RBG_16_58_17]OHE17384.1 MAG: hypothetical protein A2X96_03035 [Syntrophobacterales bacterium GWC2_56_13]